MQEQDNDFFEAYKRLDRLCSDIYGCQNGVSQYIDDLEHTSYSDRLAVPTIEQTYRELKHLRWIRNQIAHDSGQFPFSEEQDVRSVNDFFDAILKGNDPLTRLRKYREASKSCKKHTRQTCPDDIPPVSELQNKFFPPPPHTGHACKVLLPVIFIVVFVILVYLFL